MVFLSLSLKISRILQLIFLNQGWPSISESAEGKTMDKRRLQYWPKNAENWPRFHSRDKLKAAFWMSLMKQFLLLSFRVQFSECNDYMINKRHWLVSQWANGERFRRTFSVHQRDSMQILTNQWSLFLEKSKMCILIWERCLFS